MAAGETQTMGLTASPHTTLEAVEPDFLKILEFPRASPPASSSSTRTVADPVYDFGNRRNRRGENWRRLRDVAMEAGTAALKSE
jgi:hypothetical protein